MKRLITDYVILLGLAGIIVALDQWTKWLVRTRLAFNDEWAPWSWLLPYARVIHIQNTGAAFGSFQNFGSVFMVLAIVVSVGILIFFSSVPHEDLLLRIVLSMVLGGAVGNLVDRFTQGGRVTDFISVGNFAVFNVADASLSTGVAILVVGTLIRDWREKQENAESTDQTQPPPESPSESQPGKPSGE